MPQQQARSNSDDNDEELESFRPSDDQTQHDAHSDYSSGADGSFDDLINEIDSVLEEDAREFVAGYIQKGGQ